MTSERQGDVALHVGDLAVSLRFSWAVIDSLGPRVIDTRIAEMLALGPGSLTAAAELVTLTSGGMVTFDMLADADAQFPAVCDAVVDAWALALHGPTRKPVEDRHEPDPPMRRPTWLRRLLSPPSRPD